MRILILGVNGMIGHRLFSYFAERYETYGTLRDASATITAVNRERVINGIDVRDFERLSNAIANIKPNIVLNCTGIVKQISEKHAVSEQILLNAVIPHRLAELSQSMNFKSVTFSSDCVFDGLRGDYTEDDTPNATDIYGATKALGEVDYANALTIRTSTVGIEIGTKHGLVEWFLSQRGQIDGYARAIYSGLTTLELARYVEHILVSCPDLFGLHQAAADKISKFELLNMLSEKLDRRDIEIVKNIDFKCDRSLDGSNLQSLTQYCVPSWDAMLTVLVSEIEHREKFGNSNLR
jgi:dTDP-4-dehydrorhamnose reductase